MKDKDIASPSKQKNTFKILAILAILLFVGIAFLSSGWTPLERATKGEDASAITLWLWLRNTPDSGVLSSLFKGTTDLETKVIATGFIDENGEFTESRILYANKSSAIKIYVKNNGKDASTNWNFEIKLPTEPPFTYVSDSFTPLQKNEEKTFFLTFDKINNKEVDSIEVQVISEDEDNVPKNNTDTIDVLISQ